MRKLLKSLANSTSPNSLAAMLRRKRFKLFLDLISRIDHTPITILDIGGWQAFWEVVGFSETPHKIILLNTHAIEVRHKNFISVIGDARKLESFEDNSIDVVFSNSVIEHLGTYQDQQQMANEVRRVGKKYFIQTPSYYFPIETHFLFPFYHWLPMALKVFFIRMFSLGFISRAQSKEHAFHILKEFRLLKKTDMKALFPDAFIRLEKILGFTKSYIAIKY